MAVVTLPQYTSGIPDDKSVVILATGCALFSVAVCFVSMLMGSIAAAVFTFVVLFITLLKVLMCLSNLALRVEDMELKEPLISKWERELQDEKKKSIKLEETIKVRDDELKECDATVAKLTEWVHVLGKDLGQRDATVKELTDAIVEKQKEWVHFLGKELGQRDATVKKLTDSVRFLGKQLEDIRDMVVCPIARNVPRDPVITSTGIMYSHDSFEAYKERMGRETCPMTSLPVTCVYKVPALKQICEKIIELMKNGENE
jgi:hypothetical protein